MNHFLKNSIVGLVILFTIFPHTTFSMEMNKKTALICTGALVAGGLTCYKSLTTLREHRDIEAIKKTITHAHKIKNFINTVYYPIIKNYDLNPFINRRYEAPFLVLALPKIDKEIEQQVMLGNRSDSRIAAQFPFIAFQQKIITDQEKLTEAIIELYKAEDVYYKKYSDSSKYHYRNLLDDFAVLSEIANLHEKIIFIRHRIPYLPETRNEYPKFEAWEKEQSTSS